MNYLEINQRLWDDRVAKHMASDFYDNESFMSGRNSLNTIELELLGDVSGLSIAHLQCHFGQDSLSLARMGAQVTGVDFSSQAIAKAKELNAALGLSAKFVCSDILTMHHQQPPLIESEAFDCVFASYGVLGWHPSVNGWFDSAAKLLKPGGRLILVEFHPFIWMFDSECRNIRYSYFNQGPITEQNNSSYTDGSETEESVTEVGWNHPLQDIFSAALEQNMLIQSFNEYDYSPYECFSDMVAAEQGYQFKEREGMIPLVYGLVATKR